MKIQKQEKMPCEWSEEILCPVYKQWNRKQCNDYRRISLLNIKYFRYIIIQDVQRGKVNIVGGHSIGHSKQKC